MSKGEETRERMITTATRLFQAQGYAATGLKQILSESGTPRGSLYFHFPDGKEELAVEVVARHGEDFAQTLEEVMNASPDAVTSARQIVDLLARECEATACQTGCPVGAIAFEMANTSERLRKATREVFERWSGILARRLSADGISPDDARQRARAAICAIEGALVLTRAYGDASILHDLRERLPALLSD
ncbi:TetR/AcrR family transcriptional regulator [Bradymonadaceae bacterium TMQ3]|uniref:TetR/AcrR family transcriptional regulator n=1 Tax=Lujinxingia sediminis TaxID=2480984 RepID=A0ABY0CXA1_9DELT|nr:TetR/AcrR family transcriptional regulator [Lujinxingia sediminis]RDV39426.1 TetR/AcrR family transcriptional regulator [Bradymonadaceae bacterium TMQ3]RVU48527.1 TetR/AcrR family transcriptional regulator [Lujinxingia sediminis]TXC77828.1 TetR/AcrR family transcriptional regulator [Bradymonadales bacterium TMQ1]